LELVILLRIKKEKELHKQKSKNLELMKKISCKIMQALIAFLVLRHVLVKSTVAKLPIFGLVL